jgi:hypothetical protein
MLVWAAVGACTGWLFAYRLRAIGVAFLLAVGALAPLAVLVILRRTESDAFWGLLSFWATAQAGYLVGAVGRDRRMQGKIYG